MLTQRQQEVHNLMISGWSNDKIAKHLNISYGTVRKHKQAINRWFKNNTSESVEIQETEQQFETEFKTESGRVSSKSVKLRTVEDVIKFANINLDVWEVERVKTKSWEMPRKNKEIDLEYIDGKKTGIVKDHGGFCVETMYGIDVFFKKKISDPVLEGIKVVIDKIYKNPPVLSSKRLYKPANLNMLEFSLCDSHFGKLAVNGEGTEESTKIYSLAVDNLLDKTTGYDISKVLFPLGSDFFHINNFQKTTKRGTAQDTDKGLYDIFEIGIEAIINAIYKLREVAPVDIVWVPGNHDFETSYFLCQVIKAQFSGDLDIKVDISKNPRKYYRYGCSLIGLTHGNEEKMNDLPLLLMNENKNNLSGVDYCEWHIGHVHRKREMKYLAGDSMGSVSIKTLPSLSATDYWHLTKGYIGVRAAEAYLWNYENGPVGNFICNGKEIGY